MTWVRLDDGYPGSRKVKRLSDAAFRLDIQAICWCSEHLTDGFVPDDEIEDDVGRRIKKPRAAAAELVASGRWEEVEGGWSIHDYLVYNPSREDVLAKRAADARRKRTPRGIQPESDKDSTPESERNPSGLTTGLRAPRPVPSPIPPNPPPSGGQFHQDHKGQHPNCRRCRTNLRAEPEKPPPPPLCGNCEQRWVWNDDGTVARCPRCHPDEQQKASA